MPAESVDANLVQQLEYELKSAQEDLQQTIEDLRAANEELMSVNEEFQSSNEELETSKEELQSLNEELTTANAQLEGKIDELEAANNDLDNLLNSTRIATLFLDTNLHIRRFTPAATRLFSLIASDVGRSIGDITPRFSDPDLMRDIAIALEHSRSPKTEVQGHDGRWYVRQVLPYRTRDERTEGVVLTFSDVAAEALHEARLFAEAIVDSVRDPLLVLDGNLRVRSANRSYYATFHTRPEDTVDRQLDELGDRQFRGPKLTRRLRGVLRNRTTIENLELQASFSVIGERILRLTARPIDRGAARLPLILLAVEDVTDRVRDQAALEEIETREHVAAQVRVRQAELAQALRISTLGELASNVAHELNQPLSAIANGVEACARYVRSGSRARQKLLGLLDEASGEALRASAIIDHLRHFIDKGKPQFARIDLAEIVAHLPHMMARELHNENVKLQIDAPARAIPIYADGIQIEQVFVNLLQNAIDAIVTADGPQRDIVVRVRTGHRKVDVVVIDSGTGVSPKAGERLFEPFFTTKARGLGMGLAISRSIVEAHRGRLYVEEPPADHPTGATIHLTLPLLQAARANRKKRGKAVKRSGP